MKTNREATIEQWMERIDRSKLSAPAYLARYDVPFGVSQYYRYRARLGSGNPGAFRDGRESGNHRRLDAKAEGFLEGYVSAHPEVRLAELQDLLWTRFEVTMSRSGLSRCLKRLGCILEQPSRSEAVERRYASCGGFELIVALACHADWPRKTAERIQAVMERTLNHSKSQEPDCRGRNQKGQFTSRYNRRRDVRASRFSSVASKRTGKRFESMSLATASPDVLMRKCLAALALPLITHNGMLRSVNVPLGNALVDLCGVNYKQATLSKFFAEMKYLGMAEDLLRWQVDFWQEHWKEHPQGPLSLPLLCYYVDGNTKALWSKKRVKKSKVTMLGRVMGCLEQVFVHDMFGRPIYFETYSGQAPVGEYVLSLFEKIEASLEGPGEALPVNRAIVMDGAGNSVRTLRAFAAQDKYHYITSLDDNQWTPRRIRQRGRPRRYHYGSATLRDCDIELEDSREKGYLVTSRAVEVTWDYGKRTVLLTSLEPEVVGPSEVVKAYFDRWPDQELTFRSMKLVASLHRVAGYGKQKGTDENVVEKQQKLRERIARLNSTLEEPLCQIAEEEKRIDHLIRQERPLRIKSRIVKGHRILPQRDQERLKVIDRDIAAAKRRIRAIEKSHGKTFPYLRKAQREWLRLQGKETVYRVDVELDQIMAFFRVSLVHFYTQLAHEIFGKAGVALHRLVQTILFLPAMIEETATTKRVILQYNEKDPETMARLQTGLNRLNAFECRNLQEKQVTFHLEHAIRN